MTNEESKKHPLKKPSKELAALIGDDKKSERDAQTAVLDYAKKQKLIDIGLGDVINPDKKIAAFAGKDPIRSYLLREKVSAHLS